MEIDLAVLIPILSGIAVIAAFIVAAVVGIIRWTKKVEKTASDRFEETKDEVKEVEKQVKTSNGKTLGNIVEELAKTTNQQLEVLTHIARSNKEMIEQMGKRMDEHMTFGGHHIHKEGEQ